jgi:hypothetical protein
MQNQNELEMVLGGRIGDPTSHQRYITFKNGEFSDFKLTWNEKTYLTHKCVLFSESIYFQKLLESDWKDATEGEIIIPDKKVPDSVVKIFFLFLYTNLITESDFHRLCLELYDLSTFLQVKKLNQFCLKKYLTVDTAKHFITENCSPIDPVKHVILADFVASEYQNLIETKFPFHKLGKTVLAKVFEKLSSPERRCHYRSHDQDFSNFSRYPHCLTCLNCWAPSNTIPYSLGPNIGNASIHPHYEMLKKVRYSDFTLKWNKKEYPVHKYILFSESLYFQTFLKSNWMESNSGTLDLPESWVSQKSFEDFLTFLYTNVITEEALKDGLFDLYYLADYFQVGGLKELAVNGFKKYLNGSNVAHYLTMIRSRNILELKTLLLKFIIAHHQVLSKAMFPFHKVGKIMLLKIFKGIAIISKKSCHLYYHDDFLSLEKFDDDDEEEDEEEGEEEDDEEIETF